MRLRTAALLLLAAGCVPGASSPARAPTAAHPAVTLPSAPASRADTSAERRGQGGPGPVLGAVGPGEPAPRPYSQVITSRARTREGLFRTHLLGPRLYYEIPAAELGRDMLLVTQIARNAADSPFSYAGEAIGNQVLRWERRDNRILLRGVTYDVMADSALPIARAVEAANYYPIIASFNIEAFGRDSAAVIDVSRLFTSPSPEFGLGNRFRGGLDRERSFIERVAPYPNNVEVEATQTYTIAPRQVQGVPEELTGGPRTATVLVHWSMVRLPDRPMMPRLHDHRVGYFSVGKTDYGSEEQRAARTRFITRWRLECPPGETPPCNAAKPIEFYLDPATPVQWRPWVKRGVEAWSASFEAAGFRHAIVARDAPTAEQDPDWAAEDARYSVIRWVPSPVENAVGPHVHDPRSGEILEADVLIFHNILSTLRNWYFVQVGPLDPRAQRLPLPDSLMGRLVEHVISHEVGHTLGLQHNMKASSMYPADSVRSASFVRRMGHTPSIMDYARLNYVAQPEDRIPVDELIPGVGPYDEFAIAWGYRPIANIRRPEEERAVLDTWARVQDERPWLRFSAAGTGGADLGDHTEAVGDEDAVRSTRLGLRNLERVIPMLLPATMKPGEDYRDLTELYGAVVSQWSTELDHVATLIGAVESQEKYGGQAGVKFTPVPRQRQVEAMRFLTEEAFSTPEYLLDPEILRRIEVQGALDRVGRAQSAILRDLTENRRMRRMVEYEALATDPSQVYTLAEMLTDLRRGIWSELERPTVTIAASRRNLQRSYLEMAKSKVNPGEPQRVGSTLLSLVASSSAAAGDERALLRGELRTLDAALRGALPRARDRTTRLHLEDAREQIQRVLEPNS
ncbi:MAG: zinc-dependent metalloprotease [Gemmatimonadetes bacterium]|nr:zinc-dependent metalloprotease [Gemmatimonadota bacterium]